MLDETLKHIFKTLSRTAWFAQIDINNFKLSFFIEN